MLFYNLNTNIYNILIFFLEIIWLVNKSLITTRWFDIFINNMSYRNIVFILI